ncbi:MAG: hypothetical protein ACXITV_00565 [Luteibaculaceae bacterium]
MQFDFPQYRKYKNNQRFFKILNTQELVELSLMGKFYEITNLEAKTLPERNLISDLLVTDGLYTDVITAEEYETALIRAKSELKAFGSAVKNKSL